MVPDRFDPFSRAQGFQKPLVGSTGCSGDLQRLPASCTGDRHGAVVPGHNLQHKHREVAYCLLFGGFWVFLTVFDVFSIVFRWFSYGLLGGFPSRLQLGLPQNPKTRRVQRLSPRRSCSSRCWTSGRVTQGKQQPGQGEQKTFPWKSNRNKNSP